MLNTSPQLFLSKLGHLACSTAEIMGSINTRHVKTMMPPLPAHRLTTFLVALNTKENTDHRSGSPVQQQFWKFTQPSL
jgi:hypothetical protein